MMLHLPAPMLEQHHTLMLLCELLCELLLLCCWRGMRLLRVVLCSLPWPLLTRLVTLHYCRIQLRCWFRVSMSVMMVSLLLLLQVLLASM